jgi:hypothetical protein
MDEHDPLNLDATAHLDPEVEAEKAALLRKIAVMRATIESPRYARFFADPRLADKKLLEDNLRWAEEHVRRDGEMDDEGDFSLDVARTKVAWAEDSVSIVTERVDDWASDPL